MATSARPSVIRVREFWEGWFAQYPDDKKVALAARFQSYDDHHHLSAFLELFTFAVLKRAGYDLEVEPEVGSHALEFLAVKGDLRYFVECTATGQRPSEVSVDSREADVTNAIDDLPTGRYVVGVNFLKHGDQAPSLKRIRRDVGNWLSSLPVGSAAESEYLWEEDGWSVRFWAVPFDENIDEGEDDDEGGLGFIGPKVFDGKLEGLRLRGKLDRKASKYGVLDAPLLVVTTSTQHQGEHDLMTALLGDVVWYVNLESKTGFTGRKANGLFHDTAGPRNIALSAVIHGYFGVLRFAEPGKSFRLVHHPFAAKPLPHGLFSFCEERYFDAAGQLVTQPSATSVAGFFGLPPGWPHYDQDAG